MVLGKKTGKSGVKDGAFRMAKTGAAMGIGSAVTMAGRVLGGASGHHGRTGAV